MEKYNYTRVSDFIRDAVLDKRLTQRQVVEIEPYKIDNNRLIPQVIDAIRTYDFRLARAITAFEEALNIPYVDPADPYARQATPPNRSRPRRQNRVADPVYGREEAGGDGIVKKKYTDVLG